jgi:CRISPR-associated protein Csx14
MPATFIATLGSEPQVVTAALHLLRLGGAVIRQVEVVHTAGKPVQQAARVLQDYFSGEEIPLALTPILSVDGSALEDVQSPKESQAAFRALYRSVKTAKLAGLTVHLCIAGGRKSMAVFGMAAAQMLFDDDDRLWLLHSQGDFLASKRLIPGPGDLAHLEPIPVVRWSQVSPVWIGLDEIDDPMQALGKIERLRLEETMTQARSFVLGVLTPAEQRAVELLVREGLSDQEIAVRFTLSPRTVEQQLRAAYHKAAAHWDVEDVSRAQLVALLNLYYRAKITGKPA